MVLTPTAMSQAGMGLGLGRETQGDQWGLARPATGSKFLGLPFVSLTDVRATRINLPPSTIRGKVQCGRVLGQSSVNVLPESNSTNEKTLKI